MSESIIIKGARVNNLKNIDLEIPRGKFVVVTGISGSGKSSLAFDTLYAEGQRRFAESISSYARQFLGRMSKPDVDLIDGIPPAIAIEQKVNVKNPRSTVATTTEIYDFLRLIFARIGRTYSPVSGREVHKDGPADVMRWLEANTPDTLYILANLHWSERDDKVELMLGLKEDGYSRLYVDGGVMQIDDVLQLDGAFPEDAWLLIDRLKVANAADYTEDKDLRTRLLSSISDAFSRGSGSIRLVAEIPSSALRLPRNDSEPETGALVGEHFFCETTSDAGAGITKDFCSRFELDGITFREPDDYLFSFNSPLGACPVCGGLGKIIGISEDLVVPDKTKSIYDGAIACWRGDKMGWFTQHLVHVAPRYKIRPFEPYCNLSEAEKDIIWNGHSIEGDEESIVGINEFFEWVHTQRYKIQYKFMENRFSGRTNCTECHGSRLRKEALYVKVTDKNIGEILAMTTEEALAFFRNLTKPETGALVGEHFFCETTSDAGAGLTATEIATVAEPIKEIISRLECIEDVGLGYLTLNRTMNTLSGGESQRVNLVTALGSSLVGSLYILDEPSIGLHSRDTERLISVLRRLRDLGNTVLVVEHDEDIIRAADLLIDMGPLAGVNGGEVVFNGSLEACAGVTRCLAKRSLANERTGLRLQDSTDEQAAIPAASLTLQYLAGKPRYQRAKRSWNYAIRVEGAMEHNLKDITVEFPLRVLTVVTGVSGSGKSSLVGDILYPALNRYINDSGDLPGTHRRLAGNLDRITRVEYVDQNPIGRSTRSNPVTYLKVYDEIRKLLSDQQYAKINGYGPSYFSFNQEGGRCPECQGEGVVTIPMQFMSDVTMVCEQCGGKRFKQDILEVRYREKNIDDILNMSIDDAIAFFAEGKEEAAQNIARKLQPLVDVGLGYLKLGQSSSTLSGGESQRIKLAYFLSLSAENRKREKIMFIFDEPTTGLHFFDVEKLLKAFDALLDAGHSLVVVEHNPDVIRSADWLIDLGPDAGDRGGEVVFAGTPEQMISSAQTFTAQYLRR
ncbi:MAG: excinuclease ABC subunit A [Bacteroidales bacterium]|nr:excinuclease ABC subunit A [Bacteroidales bacterium]